MPDINADIFPPAAISDLLVLIPATDPDFVQLTFTSSGDDFYEGTCKFNNYIG